MSETEARAEAERRWPAPNSSLYEGLRIGFVLGSEWQASPEVTDAELNSAVLAYNRAISKHYWPTEDPDEGIEPMDYDFMRAALEAARAVRS